VSYHLLGLHEEILGPENFCGPKKSARWWIYTCIMSSHGGLLRFYFLFYFVPRRAALSQAGTESAFFRSTTCKHVNFAVNIYIYIIYIYYSYIYKRERETLLVLKIYHLYTHMLCIYMCLPPVYTYITYTHGVGFWVLGFGFWV
jgi:hypothetical protein